MGTQLLMLAWPGPGSTSGQGASELLPMAQPQTDPVQTSLSAGLWVSLPVPTLGPLRKGIESENIKICSRSQVEVREVIKDGIELNGRPASSHTRESAC